MPKIIENLPQKLLEEARRQIQANGYTALTIRSVAKGCGVGIGTVYNYYASKDALVAAFMLADWKQCVTAIDACSRESETPEPVLRAIYDNLAAFSARYDAIFRDKTAASGFSGSFGRYHALLRSQLAAPVRKFCPDDFTADFLAESMLVWTVTGIPFETIFPVIKKLL